MKIIRESDLEDRIRTVKLSDLKFNGSSNWNPQDVIANSKGKKIYAIKDGVFVNVPRANWRQPNKNFYFNDEELEVATELLRQSKEHLKKGRELLLKVKSMSSK